MQIFNPFQAKINLLYPILTLGLVLNILALKSAILGLILGVLWLIFTSSRLGNLLFPNSETWLQKVLGLVINLILIILLSSTCFYVWQLNSLAIILVVLLISACSLLAKPDKLFLKISLTKPEIFYTASYLLFYILSFYLLFKNQSSEALLSPWDQIPKIFFILYFILNIILFKIIISFTAKTKFKLILISLHFFLSLIIAVIVYKIGFGFDPFVHRAAETKLLELGYILPKPLYYIGQYSLVVFLSKTLFLPVSLIDKILVPFLASLLIPTTSFYSLKNIVKNKTILLLITHYSLLITLPLFFYTVPQSLANLFLLIFVFLLFPYLTAKTKIPLPYILFALAILLIHPLSGLPAFIILGFVILKNNLKTQIFSRIYLFWGSLMMPIFFLLASTLLNNFHVKLSLNNLQQIPALFQTAFNYLPFYSVYHLIYLYKFNTVLLFIIVIILGFFYLKKINHTLPTYLNLTLILFLNLIFMGFLEFGAVIDYEQGEFIKRFLQTILLVLSPLFLIGLYTIIAKITQIKKGSLIIVVASSLLLTFSLYLSYPHDDAFTKARGYSVSQSDLKAVNWINQDSQNSAYIVLANQSTSAAALQQFGFAKYYNNLFYYPLPTSSPLYDIYLKLIYNQPDSEQINQARELTGVNTIYFVINDYWLDASKRIEQYSAIASQVQNINNQIWIFKFE